MPEIRDEEIERVNMWIQTLSSNPQAFPYGFGHPDDPVILTINQRTAYELLKMLKDYKRFLVGNMMSAKE